MSIFSRLMPQVFYPRGGPSLLQARDRPRDELVEHLVTRGDQGPDASLGVRAGGLALGAEAALRDERGLPQEGGAKAHHRPALAGRVEYLVELVQLDSQRVARPRAVGG